MNKEIDVVALVGGRGKRMGKLTENSHKYLLEIEGKLILAHLLDGIQEAFG